MRSWASQLMVAARLAAVSLVISACASRKWTEGWIELGEESPHGEIQLAVSHGSPDVHDRYPAVVLLGTIVEDPDPKKTGPSYCSGVLIEKDLVLTAAHCLCAQAFYDARNEASKPDTIPKDTIIEAGKCAKNIMVLKHKPTITNSRSGFILDSSAKFTEFPGVAFLPDEFRMTLNEKGILESFRADLAVVRLNGEINVPIEHKFPERALVQGAEILVVGFGSTVVGGNVFSATRHFGTTTVTDIHLEEYKEVPSSDEQHTEYASDKKNTAHIEEGDSGGPCFQEDELGQRWLVGIIQGKRPAKGLKTVCISTFHSELVIGRLIRNARAVTMRKTLAKPKSP